MRVAMIDLDCFYAQVEMVNNPLLKDKPIGIKQKRLMVTCNYTARNMGVSKIMSLSEAKQQCPSLIIIDGSNIDRYREASNMVFQFLQQFGTVQKNGMDEFFISFDTAYESDMDYSRCHFYGDSGPLLLELSKSVNFVRFKLLNVLGYTSSAGIADSKLFAKLCANMHKPFQQTTISIDYGKEFIKSVSVEDIPGFGHASRNKFNISEKMTALEFTCAYSKSEFIKVLGHRYSRIYDLMLGIDNSIIVNSSADSTQISVEDTCNAKQLCPALFKLTRHLLELINCQEFVNNRFKRWPKTCRILYGESSFKRKSKSIPWPLNIGEIKMYKKLTAYIIKTVKPLLDADVEKWSINIAATNFIKLQSTTLKSMTVIEPQDTQPQSCKDFLCKMCGCSFPLFAKTAHYKFHEEESAAVPFW
eukprot:NODE_132_length_18298_cov_0.443101.p4 type:complete len:417 gc:universal NODE_132_length_18298_cov_0.443101:8616-9866(+)